MAGRSVDHPRRQGVSARKTGDDRAKMAVQRIDEAVLGMVRDSMSPADFAVLLGLFRNDMAERVASLRLALAGPDRDLLERTLHQMVGTAGNMGATDLADAAREIERTAATAPAVRKTCRPSPSAMRSRRAASR